ncbi:MAG: hypothetical protein ACPLZ9_06550 [Candidatus Ratteibacteria bacterium]
MSKIAYPSAFILGVFVSIFESGCTGQVYLPVILFLSTENYRKNIIFLLIYNLFFILPLVFVFLFSYIGVKTKTFSKILEKNILISKLLISIFFLFLSILFIFFIFSVFPQN